MPTPREEHLDLPASAASVPAGRHFVRDLLHDWGYDGLLDTAELLVSELITNGVRHAGSAVRLTVCAEDEVRVTVTDYRPDLLPVPLDHRPRPDEEGGRGLSLVAMLSDDWGVHRLATGKAVWFTLRGEAAR